MPSRIPQQANAQPTANPRYAAGIDEAAGTEKGVQRLHRVGARLAASGRSKRGMCTKNAGRAVAIG